MTKKVFVLGTVLLMAVVAFAREGKDVKLTGYVIDNACSARAAGENGAEKVKNHTVKCAMMPPCAKSGYAVFADGKLYKLDEEGNKKAADILKNTKAEKGVQVAVEGTLDGDILKVTKIVEVGS
jgi:type 1 fimbria pilin